MSEPNDQEDEVQKGKRPPRAVVRPARHRVMPRPLRVRRVVVKQKMAASPRPNKPRANKT